LGITGRHVQVKYPANRGFQKQSKVLAFNVKTAGDWLKVKRLEKNLTPGHVALKMGIAASLVCSWESGSRQPDTDQMKILAAILGFNPRDVEPLPIIPTLTES
jgi:DNA-binding transcriptional regulator YiaG